MRSAAATTPPGIRRELRRRRAGYSPPSAVAPGNTGATIGATDACEGEAGRNEPVGEGIGAIEDAAGVGIVPYEGGAAGTAWVCADGSAYGYAGAPKGGADGTMAAADGGAGGRIAAANGGADACCRGGAVGVTGAGPAETKPDVSRYGAG